MRRGSQEGRALNRVDGPRLVHRRIAPIDALARPALAGGTFVGRPFPAGERAGDEDLDRNEPRFSATRDGRCGAADVLSQVVLSDECRALMDDVRRWIVRMDILGTEDQDKRAAKGEWVLAQ